ncbi:toll/interleukin-1 receptor domain-containing protein [Corallococcus exiguus]|uniref:toll/interleukin-1 receptor domain-containing protein n=1 Tax=Corallococcus exiguus TaxID=83462 RepID=UPI003DA432EB
MPRPRIFISHSSKEPAGEQFRDELAQRLRDEGYRVLLDKDEFELSQDWRSTLNAWIGGCDAAVLLVSSAALQSRYVAYEASVLAYRHGNERGRFILIPVYLAPVTEKQVEESPLEPARIADVQAIRGDVPRDEAIQRIIDYLESHVSSDSAAERHARRLCGLLKDVNSADLEAAADKVGALLAPWVLDTDLPMKVALGLMAVGLEQATQGVRAFRSRLPSVATLEEVMTLIATSWVDFRSVAEIRKVEKQPGVLALNGDDPRTAWLYVVGACDLPANDSWRVAKVDGVVGSGGIDELKGMVRTALAYELKVSPDDVPELLELLRSEAEPVFVALPLCGVDKAAMDALRAEFRGVTFFFLTGSDIPPKDQVEEAGIVLLQPLLAPEIEQPFWTLYEKKLKYLKLMK